MGIVAQKDIPHISAAERLELIEDIWNGLAGDLDPKSLSPKDIAATGSGPQTPHRDAGAGSTWSLAKDRLKRRA